jgi:hypothetical protein
MRLPVAAKNALSTAGAATKIVGSPTPPMVNMTAHTSAGGAAGRSSLVCHRAAAVGLGPRRWRRGWGMDVAV